jgi:ketosteroid isomerase-like protein
LLTLERFGVGINPLPGTDQPPPDEAAIRRQFDAWNRGDFEGWLGEEAHPDIEYEAGILVGRAEGKQAVFRGREELRQFFDEWHSQWRMEIKVGALERVGDWLLMAGSARLTGVQSGASIEQEIGVIAQYEDGLLRRLRSFPNPEMARAAAERG